MFSMNCIEKIRNIIVSENHQKKFAFLCFLIFVSCTGNQSRSTYVDTGFEQLPIIKIEPPPRNLPYLLLSEIADSIHYVALETNKDCLLSSGLGYSITSGFLFLQEQIQRKSEYLCQIFLDGKIYRNRE